jgi:transcriptional regulator with XRE-family HTH domain
MQTTLAERLKNAMAGPPKITGMALAKACGVSQPSVSDWLNGTTRSLDGVNLVTAAEFLQVSPKWLATGLGIRSLPAAVAGTMVSDVTGRYVLDCWIVEAVKILNSLQAHQREGAVAALRTHVGNLTPPNNGQTLSMAA